MYYSTPHPVTYYFYPLFEVAPVQGDWSAVGGGVLDTPTSDEVDTLLYIHIPYCQDLCRFCPFHVRVDKGDEVYARYVDALCREIEMIGTKQRARTACIRAIYFGGGSPSILPPVLLSRLFSTLRASFVINKETEISFEGEPKTLGDPHRLDVLRAFDVSRISFGLQTFDETLRQHFNIAATLTDINRCTRLAREWGFEEINIDMMYNLPGQTIAQLEVDVARVIEEGYDSVDYYNLHYYAFPKKFKEQMVSGEIPRKPADGVMMALAEQLRYLLTVGGYRNVADQVFSKKSAVCEYFRLLWGGGDGNHDAETLAIGASARGYVDGVCYMNFGNTNRYMEAVERGELPIEKVSSRLTKPENRGAVLFSKFFRLSKKYGDALASLPEGVFDAWINEGYVYDAGDAWALSERGKLWTNNITYDAFEPAQALIANTALRNLAAKPGVRTGTF